jgi:hypothetical protein
MCSPRSRRMLGVRQTEWRRDPGQPGTDGQSREEIPMPTAKTGHGARCLGIAIMTLAVLIHTPASATASVWFEPPPLDSATEEPHGSVVVKTPADLQALGSSDLTLEMGQIWQTEVDLGSLVLHVVTGSLTVRLDAGNATVHDRSHPLLDITSWSLGSGYAVSLQPGDSLTAAAGAVLTGYNEAPHLAIAVLYRQIPLHAPIAPDLEIPIAPPTEVLDPISPITLSGSTKGLCMSMSADNGFWREVPVVDTSFAREAPAEVHDPGFWREVPAEEHHCDASYTETQSQLQLV